MLTIEEKFPALDVMEPGRRALALVSMLRAEGLRICRAADLEAEQQTPARKEQASC